MSSPLSSTPVSLLGRIHAEPGNPSAWRDLVYTLTPALLAWARRCTGQDADAHDLVQEIFLRLSRHLHNHDPRRRFCPWFNALAWNAFRNYRERISERRGTLMPPETLDLIAAQADLERRIDEAFARERLAHCYRLARLRVEEATWQAFALTVLDELSVEEAACRLQMKPDTVLRNRNRVRRLVEEWIERLRRQEEL